MPRKKKEEVVEATKEVAVDKTVSATLEVKSGQKNKDGLDAGKPVSQEDYQRVMAAKNAKK